MVLLCNLKVKSFDHVSDLEHKFDEAKQMTDIVHIQGGLHKQETCWRIRLLWGKVANGSQNWISKGSCLRMQQMLLSTTMQLSWCCDSSGSENCVPCSMNWAAACASRVSGYSVDFLLLADLRSFDYLMSQALVNSMTEEETLDIQQEFATITTVISPLTPNTMGDTQQYDRQQ